jgi:glycosyltransferase involved in cell wall biosynthesis
MGERQDAIELTSELTVSALTSTREPLGRVILEAHLVGTPVVVPSAGGPAEIVEDGVTGLHFDASAPDAVEQFASQVMRLLGDETLRACLIERARERVLETFAGRKHITIQQDCFLELAAKKGGRA